jgi:hypothetical protein
MEIAKKTANSIEATVIAVRRLFLQRFRQAILIKFIIYNE